MVRNEASGFGLIITAFSGLYPNNVSEGDLEALDGFLTYLHLLKPYFVYDSEVKMDK